MKKGNPVNERPDNKKQLILDAAARCLKKRGLENVNMREIAKEAKVSLGTVSYYFPTKDHILMNIFIDFVKKVLKTIQYDSRGINPRQRLNYFIHGFLNEIIANPSTCQVFMDLWSHTTNNPELRELLQSYYKNSLGWLENLIKDGNKTGHFNVANPIALATYIFAIIDGLKVQLHLLNMNKDMESMRPIFEKFIKQNLNDNLKKSAVKNDDISQKNSFSTGVNALFDLEGKTAIVAGSSRGLGFTIARGLAEAGANIVICSRNKEQCDKAAQEIAGYGANVIAVHCDLTDTDDVESLIRKTISHYGHIDILINNAGYISEELLDISASKKLNQTMDVSLKSPFHCTMAAGKYMIGQNSGKIINIIPIAETASAETGPADNIFYSARKGAITAFTRVLAYKWSRYNINVNAIAPGYFETEMSRYKIGHRNIQLADTIPMKRLGIEQDIKGAAVFLSSPAANYITGQIMAVDGGAMG
jgi:gluconate 5-dehydrogenase